MKIFVFRIPVILLFSILGLSLTISAQTTHELEGRWDLVIEKDSAQLPSWLEITHSGRSTLVGRFVYAFGSARAISEIKVDESGKFSFAIPPQWEPGNSLMKFEGQLHNGTLNGTMVYTDGQHYEWNGVRAPSLTHSNDPTWGTPIELFNGQDLKGWHATGENQWVVESNILKSPKSGSNLVTDEKFMNFKLHAEFRYPKGSNSGIYLRGRYEVQIADSKGMAPSNIQLGAVYGFLTPNMMAAKDPGEWQTYDITLIGNRVTIIANGHSIITDQIIPGITGGALSSDEGAAGPFFVQGDHGPIEFKKFIVTPMVE